MMLTIPWVDIDPEPETVGANADAGGPSGLFFGAEAEQGFRQECDELLRQAGLRPTRQRLALSWLLFGKGGRHLTAEMLHAEATRDNIRISLATVYNTLNQFTEAGLLRRIAADGIKSFFDTDTSVHPHFYLEGEDVLVDVAEGLTFTRVPEALPGHEIARLDVIVHLRRKRAR